MNYIRRIALLLCITLLVPSISGCNRNKATQFDAYTVFVNEDGSIENIWSLKNTNDYTPPAEMTVTVNGLKYTGKYTSTISSFPDFYNVLHGYRGEDFYFYIKEEKGQLALFSNVSLEKPEICAFDAAQGKQIADSIAKDYIDLRQYEVDEYVDENNNSHTHTYEYYKEFNGYKTAERVFISLNCNGELDLINLQMAGSFDNVKRIKSDDAQVNAAISSKLDEIIPEYRPGFMWTNYEEKELYLIRLENGQFALRFWLTVDLEKTEDNKITASLDVDLFVIVDYQKKSPLKP